MKTMALRIEEIKKGGDLMYQVIDNMEKYGGSFVKALAECLRRADKFNRATLVDAFAKYMDEYLPERWSNR